MRKVTLLALLAVFGSGCSTWLTMYPEENAMGLESFPSRYASDMDFVNLANSNGQLQAEAKKNIAVYYNCLVKASPENYQRKDPIVFARRRIASFSEIPTRIYENRLDQISRLVNDSNRAAMQGVVDRELKELDKIDWNMIKQEVNSIVAGTRNMELAKYSCPLNEGEIQQHRAQLKIRVLYAQRPAFIPPFM